MLFRSIGPDGRAEAIGAGPPGECLDRIRRFAARAGLELPVLDLSGADPERAALALEALAPGKNTR